MITYKTKSDCCGCSSCYSVCSHNAISMQPDEEGFLYPKVDENICVQCGLCEKVCPISNRDSKQTDNEPIDIQALRVKDNDILSHSSSGGFFTLISQYVISNGGVVFGVRYNESMEVVHSYAETMQACYSFRGSKYVQSTINDTYTKVRECLRKGRLVLFTGTPCQVDGLRRFLLKDYDKLITVDVVCHGVPSPRIFKEYVSYFNKLTNDVIIDINMRYKGGRGWGHRFSYLYTFKSGRIEVDWDGIKDWGRLYFSHALNRPSCYQCRYCSFDRPGDFSIADYWDDNNKHPEFFHKDGTSLVIINSKTAVQLLSQLSQYESIHISKDDAMQPCLKAPVKCDEKKRKEHWGYYYSHGFESYYKRFYTSSLYNKRKKLIRFLKTQIIKFIK